MKTKCTCSHYYQDQTLGKGMRIANPTGKTDTVRCTVCKKEINTSNNKIKTKAKAKAKTKK